MVELLAEIPSSLLPRRVARILVTVKADQPDVMSVCPDAPFSLAMRISVHAEVDAVFPFTTIVTEWQVGSITSLGGEKTRAV